MRKSKVYSEINKLEFRDLIVQFSFGKMKGKEVIKIEIDSSIKKYRFRFYYTLHQNKGILFSRVYPIDKNFDKKIILDKNTKIQELVSMCLKIFKDYGSK